MLIDFSPTILDVSLDDAPGFQKAAGGAPANVVVGISRLDGQSTFVGNVGDDEFGRMLADILRENKVMDRGIRFDAHARRALAFVTLKMNGEREFMFYRNPSADMLLKESEFDAEMIREASIFHYGSTSLIAKPTWLAHLTAMAIARQGGDPDNDEVVMSLLHSKLKLLLVTNGPKGCRYYTKSFRGRVDIVSVKEIDTTGAITTTKKGAIPALPDKSTVLEPLNNLPLKAYSNAKSIIDVLQEIGNLLEKTRMQPRLIRAEQFIMTIFIGSKYYVMISLYTSHIIFHIRFQVTACG